MKRPLRQRDGQQWISDYLIKATGRAVHHDGDGRTLPPQAKNIRMVEKYLSRSAENTERLAQAAGAAGDPLVARRLYRIAAERYREAQHFCVPIVGPRKRALHEKLLECAAKLRALADYPIERVEIPFEGGALPALLHLLPEGRRGPAVVFMPGMDQTKENYPNPLGNEFEERGMHVLALDGPGQGENWLRGIHVTPDSHATTARAALEFLAQRPEVEEEKIGIYGRSFGSFWSFRAAADEPRFAACAGAVACFYWDRLSVFDEAPIRFKQVFMAMAGTEDEEAFDSEADRYTLKGHAERIRCHALMVTGEFDPLNPLEQSEAVYGALGGPRELWVLEDEFHPLRSVEALGGLSVYPFVAQWMRRALAGEIPAEHERRVLIKKTGEGLFDTF
jgi:dipeptidyl aminopeptidase/acylaminoacyl peptidase